ncbi:MAG: uridine phosphorylase [Flavobacteriales bacterium]|jgi:uridine phosphorylase
MLGHPRAPLTQLSNAEFITNKRGAIYHLDLLPGELAKTILLVGDPDRVQMISEKFDRVDHQASHREFCTATGVLNGKHLSVVSTGIGVDNIDIVLNEIDAIFNIDFESRQVKTDLTSLDFIRLGTSGCMQADIRVGEVVISKYALGYDGLPFHYEGEFSDEEASLAEKLKNKVNWPTAFADPYIVACGMPLLEQLGDLGHQGITVTANGFYGPQNRQLRLPSSRMDLLDGFKSFKHEELRVLNFEMETSGLYAMASMLGHQAITLCTLLANRATFEFAENPLTHVERLVDAVLNRLTR